MQDEACVAVDRDEPATLPFDDCLSPKRRAARTQPPSTRTHASLLRRLRPAEAATETKGSRPYVARHSAKSLVVEPITVIVRSLDNNPGHVSVSLSRVRFLDLAP